MLPLRQSTNTTVRIGPFVDASDGVSEETGLAGMGVEVSKAGGTFASRHSSTSVAHDSEGWYAVALDATDTGTLGILTLKAQDDESHLPVWQSYVVVPAAVYDGLVAGSETFKVAVAEVLGVAAGDVYHADVNLTIDETNSQDEYTVVWFKNGVRLTSGVSAAAIEVVDREGDTLFNPITLEEAGAHGLYFHNEETDRTTPGQAVTVIVSATIDGSTRIFSRLVSRDSR